MKSKSRLLPHLLSTSTKLIALSLCFFAFQQEPLFAQSSQDEGNKYLAQNNGESNGDDPNMGRNNQGISDDELARLKQFRQRRRQFQNAGAPENSGSGNLSSSPGQANDDPDMPGFRMRRKGTGGGGGGFGAPQQSTGSDDNGQPRGRRGFNGNGFDGQGMPPGPDGPPMGRRRRAFNANGFTAPGEQGPDDAPLRKRVNFNQDNAPDPRAEAEDGPMRRGPSAFPPGMPPDFHAGGQRRPGQGGPFGGRALDLRPLALTDEQKQKVQEMRAQTRLRVKELHKQVAEKEKSLRDMMFNPEVSENQIRAARKELRKQQDLVDEANMNDLLGIRAMLTPEQKKHLPDCMPGKNGAANGGGPPPPPQATGSALPPAPPAGFASVAENNPSVNKVAAGGKRKTATKRRSLEADLNSTAK